MYVEEDMRVNKNLHMVTKSQIKVLGGDGENGKAASDTLT